MKPDLIERARDYALIAGDFGATIARECADALEAAAKAVGELPEIKHAGDCTTHVTSLRRDYGCDCGADEANAKRLAARKAVGLEG